MPTEQGLAGVEVGLRPPTEEGRLYPVHDPETDFVLLRSKVRRPAAHFVNIGSVLMCAADEDGLLSAVDVVATRRCWRLEQTRGTAESEFRRSLAEAAEADLQFTTRTLRHMYFMDLTVRVNASEDRSYASILLGAAHSARAIALSTQCLALVAGPLLVGFLVSLSTERTGGGPADLPIEIPFRR